jgi:uncharacterized protein (TIGR03118 family)
MTKSVSLVTIAVAVSAVCVGAWRAEATTYVQTNLVSGTPGVPAEIFDSALANPWGITETTTSPFWVADQGVSLATLYMVTNSTTVSKFTAANPPTGNITITTASGPQGPTGTVANTNMSSFLVGNGGNGAFAHFIFAGLNGTISAWNAGPTAFVQPLATIQGARYTGLAISQNLPTPQLYAANPAGFAGGAVDVFSSSFAQVNAIATPPPISAAGLVPFNVQDIGGKIYVTYAPAVPASAALGSGAVAVYSEDGTFQQILIAPGGHLAAPWGITFAPTSFGQFGGDLLVGNFSSNNISAFALNPATGVFDFAGIIPIAGPGGLLALEFGNGGNGGSPNTLYFTDSLTIEAAAADGLFGAIEPTPLPAALPLFATGLGALGLLGWRRKRKAQATA